MKRNHSLLEYTRDNDTQVSELGPSGFSSNFTTTLKSKSKEVQSGSTIW